MLMSGMSAMGIQEVCLVLSWCLYIWGNCNIVDFLKFRTLVTWANSDPDQTVSKLFVNLSPDYQQFI